MVTYGPKDKKRIEKTLKLCPFCGNEDIEFNFVHPQYMNTPFMAYRCFWEVFCPTCGIRNEMSVDADTDENWEKAKDDLIAMWNERVQG